MMVCVDGMFGQIRLPEHRSDIFGRGISMLNHFSYRSRIMRTTSMSVSVIALFMTPAMSSAQTNPTDPCVPAGTLNSGEPQAIKILIYNEFVTFSDASGGVNAGTLTTDSKAEFDEWIADANENDQPLPKIAIINCQYDAPRYAAVYSEVDTVSPEPTRCRNPIGGESFFATALIYDMATLEDWDATGFVPGFMNQVEAAEVPTVAEAAFDIIFRIPNPFGSTSTGRLRIRKSDGAVAIVSMSGTSGTQPVVAAVSSPTDCDAGF